MTVARVYAYVQMAHSFVVLEERSHEALELNFGYIGCHKNAPIKSQNRTSDCLTSARHLVRHTFLRGS